MTDGIELDPDDAAIGYAADTMERRALRVIGRVRYTGMSRNAGVTTYNLPRVCERTTLPLPHGCWDDNRSPYALYGDDRWCDACIAYAALSGTLPRPEATIDATVTVSPRQLYDATR